MKVECMRADGGSRAVHARSSMRAVWESGLSEGPDSLIKRPNFKTIYSFLIKGKGQILIK
jgi:hypothetical protein